MFVFFSCHESGEASADLMRVFSKNVELLFQGCIRGSTLFLDLNSTVGKIVAFFMQDYLGAAVLLKQEYNVWDNRMHFPLISEASRSLSVVTLLFSFWK